MEREREKERENKAKNRMWKIFKNTKNLPAAA